MFLRYFAIALLAVKFCSAMLDISTDHFKNTHYKIITNGNIQQQPITQALLANIQEHIQMQRNYAAYLHFPLWIAANMKSLIETLDLSLHEAYQDPKSKETTITFYKWCGNGPDKVPQVATSIQGASGLIVRDDPRGNGRKQVLLVIENKRIKGPGGAIDRGELVIDGLLREIKEEVSLELDTAKVNFKLIGAYNTKNARPHGVSDNFATFVVEIKDPNYGASLQPTIGDGEISSVGWFDVLEVIHGPREFSAAGFEGGKLMQIIPTQLKNYLQGGYFRAIPVIKDNGELKTYEYVV